MNEFDVLCEQGKITKRLCSLMHDAKIDTVEELAMHNPDVLVRFKGFGKAKMKEIEQLLKDYKN